MLKLVLFDDIIFGSKAYRVFMCGGMQDFFKKHGVAVMTIRELFDFIVDPCIADEAVDSYLEEVLCLPYVVKYFGEFLS